MNIEQLNTDFGLSNSLQFISGIGGAPLISIKNKCAEALISLYGGQVLAFQPHTESQDLLFLSDRADYGDGRAIRGGVPICWPWFGTDPTGLHGLNHGFVRNALWSVAETKQLSNDTTQVELRFIQTAESRPLWSYSFDLTLQITVGKTLTMTLMTHNTGDTKFTFTQALHSYFQVSAINQVRVLGLDDSYYFDKLAGGQQKRQTGPVTVSEEVDRIYLDVQKPLLIEDRRFNRHIQITYLGCQNAIVWNPWAQTSAKMSDLMPHDYQHFICVEVGTVAPSIITVEPGAEHRLETCFEIF